MRKKELMRLRGDTELRDTRIRLSVLWSAGTTGWTGTLDRSLLFSRAEQSRHTMIRRCILSKTKVIGLCEMPGMLDSQEVVSRVAIIVGHCEFSYFGTGRAVNRQLPDSLILGFVRGVVCTEVDMPYGSHEHGKLSSRLSCVICTGGFELHTGSPFRSHTGRPTPFCNGG